MLRGVRRRLYLMRHAEVSYAGERDPEVVRLTERGLEQAAAAHRALDDVAFDAVVTSSLPRTVETAAVVVPGREPEEWPEFPQFIREASRLGPDVIERFAAVLEPLRLRALMFLQHGMAEGTIRHQDPALLLFTLYTAVVGSITEAGVLRAVVGEDKSRTALRRRELEVLTFVRNALSPGEGEQGPSVGASASS